MGILFKNTLVFPENELEKAVKLIVKYRGWDYTTTLAVKSEEEEKRDKKNNVREVMLKFWQDYREDGEHITVTIVTLGHGDILVYDFHAKTNLIKLYRPERELLWETRIMDLAERITKEVAEAEVAEKEKKRKEKEAKEKLAATSGTPI